MNPTDHTTLELARRTRKNLQYMDAQKAAGADVEEFTQLLNSMLSIVISMREEYFKGKDPPVTWDAVREMGLDPDAVMASLQLGSMQFSTLITNLRHAFAHHNYELLGLPEITGLRVWNIEKGKENTPANRCWETIIHEQTLRELAFLVIDFIESDLGRYA